MLWLRLGVPEIGTLEPLLVDRAPIARQRAFEALAQLPDWPPRALTLAVDGLADPDAHVRAAVVAAFAASKAQAAQKVLKEALAAAVDSELAATLRALLTH